MTKAWIDIAGQSYQPSLEQQLKGVKAILVRDFTASLMNSTKWRELLERLDELCISYWVKFVDVSAPLSGHLQYRTERFYDSNWGPLPILAVEWIEIRPVKKAVVVLVEQLNVPFECTEDAVRITAHLRNGTPMHQT